jgi:hypothetical protein
MADDVPIAFTFPSPNQDSSSYFPSESYSPPGEFPFMPITSINAAGLEDLLEA